MAQRAGRFLISSPEDYLKSVKSFCASIEQEGDPNNCVEEHVSALIGDFVGDLLSDHSPFRILGVGSGEGSNDLSFIEMLSKIRREGVDKCQIFQRTVEPDGNALNRFRAKAEDLPESLKSRADIEFEWFPMTYQEYAKQKKKDDVKFDVVHFLHCLYYVGPETALEYCREKELGRQGVIVCQLAGEEGAFAKYGKFFSSEGIIPYPEAYYSNKVVDVAKRNDWKYVECPGEAATCNITAIFDRFSVEGKLLLDFLTEWLDVSQTLSQEKLQKILPHYWESECITDDHGRKMVDLVSRTVIIFKGI